MGNGQASSRPLLSFPVGGDTSERTRGGRRGLGEALAARESEGEGEIKGSGERSQVERGALSLLAARGRETRERVQGIEREA